MEFDKTKRSCPWNSDQNYTQNSAQGWGLWGQGMEGPEGCGGQGVEGQGVGGSGSGF